MGYYAVPRCESPGDFARKGGILDIFSVSYDNPLRIELSGDLVESIRFFDATTQRSLREIEAAIVPPCSPLILSDENVARAVDSAIAAPYGTAEQRAKLAEHVCERLHFDGMERYAPYYSARAAHRFPRRGRATRRRAPDGSREALRRLESEIEHLFEECLRNGEPVPPPEAIYASPELLALVDLLPSSISTESSPGRGTPRRAWRRRDGSRRGTGGPRVEARLARRAARGRAPATFSSARGRDPAGTAEDIGRPPARGAPRSRRRHVARPRRPPTARARHSRRPLRRAAPRPTPATSTRSSATSRGACAPDSASTSSATTMDRPIACASSSTTSPIGSTSRSASCRRASRCPPPATAFSSSPTARSSIAIASGKGAASTASPRARPPIRTLQPGDFVVHVTYGIARYLGIKTIAVEAQRDGLPGAPLRRRRQDLRHRRSDQPGREVRRQRRRPATAHEARRHLLGAGAAKAQSGDRGHGERTPRAGRGARLAPGTRVRRRTAICSSELEAAFIYDETPDQLTAIDDGEGRHGTRAADGSTASAATSATARPRSRSAPPSRRCRTARQVAVLVPTTILAQQHLGTFRERLAGFPGRGRDAVAVAQRQGGQGDPANAWRSGKIDIVVGTHRSAVEGREVQVARASSSSTRNIASASGTRNASSSCSRRSTCSA